MNRRGITLIELLIGMVLLAMVGAAITQTLTAASRSTDRALHGLAIGRTVMAAATLFREELGQSSAAELSSSGPTALDFGRTIGAGPVCGVAGNAVQLRVPDWWGIRAPVGGRDQVALLTDPLSGSWTIAGIDSATSSSCPDGAAATRLVIALTVPVASYARVVEPVRVRTYLSGGQGWWGLAGMGGLGTIQPFAGPIQAPLQPFLLSPSSLRWSFRPLFGADTMVSIPLGPP